MKTLRIIIGLILSACIVLASAVAKVQLSRPLQAQLEQQYKGILTVYHVETFEGGAGSRRQFLLSSARSFEKKNKGVLVMVSNHTKQSLENALSSGDFPDMVSFGNGINIKGLIQTDFENSITSGEVGQKTYATAWAKGGYVLIANGSLVDSIPNQLPTLLVSQNTYTQPLTALIMEEISVGSVEVKKPMDAYVAFANGKTPYFLGTQRDISRLENRGMDVIVKPLTKYNDLFQYIAITSLSSEKGEMAKQFINHLTSELEQKKLPSIKMFSPFYSCEFSSSHLNQMQNVKENYTISAFISEHELLKMQDLSLKVIMGEQNEKNKIKNMLVKS